MTVKTNPLRWNGSEWYYDTGTENKMTSSEEPKPQHPRSIDDAWDVQPSLSVSESVAPVAPIPNLPVDPVTKVVNGLNDWWMDTALAEIQSVAPKAVAYGSRDLIEMGHTLARTQGREVSDEEATELGIWFYSLGKMARWTAAVTRGERVSDDTLHDLGIYTRMAQRTRVAGAWPGVA